MTRVITRRINPKRYGESVASLLAQKKGTNPYRMSKELGLTRRIAYNAMRGVTSLYSAQKIADYYGVTLSALVDNRRSVALAQYEQSKLLGRTDLSVKDLLKAPASDEVTGLEYHRRKKRMSKKALSKLSGIDVCYISSLEQYAGEKVNRKIDCLQRLAATLGITIDELFQKHKRSELKNERKAREMVQRLGLRLIETVELRSIVL